MLKISVGESFKVATISGIEKVCITDGGEYQVFPSQIFCLTVPKNFVGEPFSVSLIAGTKKVWIRQGGEYQDFPSKIFCLTGPKNFVGERFSVSLIAGTEKIWIRRGGSIKIFRRRFLSHSAENFPRGMLYCCNNFGYRDILDKRGEYQDFASKIFCLTVPKNFVGEPFRVSVIAGTEKVWIRQAGSIKIFRRRFFVSQCRKFL